MTDAGIDWDEEKPYCPTCDTELALTAHYANTPARPDVTTAEFWCSTCCEEFVEDFYA